MANCSIPTYLPASFKSVPFEALTVGSEHGRRGAEGEFPFGEETAYADLGRRIRTYSIKGRLTGPSHVTDAAALIAACESVGPGVFIHPTRGVLNVACKKAAFSDEIVEGAGVTTVDLEFVEANDFLVGFGASIFGLAIAPLVDAALSAYQRDYQISAVPFYERPGIEALSGQAIGSIRNALVSGMGSGGDVYGWSAAADLAAAQISLSVHLSPSKMAATFDSGFQAIETNVLNVSTSYDGYRSIARFASRGTKKTGAAGMAEETTFATLRLISAAYMARSASYMPADTLDEALSRYDAIVSVLVDEEIAAQSRCDDALFISTREFRAQAQRALLTAAFESPALIEFDFSGGVPSLVAAHEIYGDARRFKEIEARNPLNWPFAIGPVVQATRT